MKRLLITATLTLLSTSAFAHHGAAYESATQATYVIGVLAIISALALLFKILKH